MVPRPDARRSSRSGPTSPSAGFAGMDDGDRSRRGAGPSASASPTPSSPSCGACAEADVRAARLAAGVRATFKTVDTCAAEFEADTPYHYSTYEDEDEVRPRDRPKVLILGSGPNRIGQGIEFDYCCVHASFALRDAGLRDGHGQLQPRDGVDRLRHLRPPLLRAAHLRGRAQRHRGRAGAPGELGRRDRRRSAARRRSSWPGSLPEGLVLGTSPGVDRPGRGPRALERAVRPARDPAAGRRHGHHARARPRPSWPSIGYPVLVRPSYVLGGRAMEIVYDDERLERAMDQLAGFGTLGREGGLSAERPGARRPLPRGRHRGRRRRHPRPHRRGAHRRGHGARRGGRACTRATRPASSRRTRCPPRRSRSSRPTPGPSPRPSRCVGLINVQYAVKANQVFVIEANPRASRTVPFVAKATGVPLVKVAARVDGRRHARRAARRGPAAARPSPGGHVAVKEAVLPFNRFPDADTVLGPEMRSHRRGHGHRHHLRPGLRQEPDRGGRPAARVGARCSCRWPTATRPSGVEAARALRRRSASPSPPPPARPTRLEPRRHPRSTPRWRKVGDATGTDAVDLISSGKVDLVVNSPRGRGPRADGAHIRAAAGVHGIPASPRRPPAWPPPTASRDWADLRRSRCGPSRSTTAASTCDRPSLPAVTQRTAPRRPGRPDHAGRVGGAARTR